MAAASGDDNLAGFHEEHLVAGVALAKHRLALIQRTRPEQPDEDLSLFSRQRAKHGDVFE